MKIVILDGYSLNPGDLSWDGFRSIGDVEIYDRTPADKIIQRSKGAEIVIINKTHLDEEFFSNMSNLKYVGVLATGYNVVDLNAAKKRDIVVTNIPTYGTQSVAQMVFALLLELCHHVQRHSDEVRAGKWSESDDFCFWSFPVIELANKTMGIIGFGRIGQQVANIADAMGMKIIAYNPQRNDQSQRANFRWVDLPELLSESDVVSLHCPLFEETRGIINKESMKKMKNTALLINTSRGPLIVEQDLADALDNGIIAGAGLDVLSVEPPSKDNVLFKAKNCIITPHIAWATKEARVRLMDIAVNNLKSFLSGNPINVIRI